jgi:hypothetical protein
MSAGTGRKPLELKVLIRRECDLDGVAAYSARCLTYDLATQGETISEVLNSMQRIVRAQVLLSLNDGIDPFSDFERAPDHLWEIYNGIREHEEKAFSFLANVEPGDLEDNKIEVSSLMKIAC